MNLIKCRSCGRLLAKIGNFNDLEIKCPRCKALNLLSIKNALSEVPRDSNTGNLDDKGIPKAPLPFVGQKRMFLKEFRKILDKIPNDGENWTIIDVFGGSGLLANNAKAYKPKATVIYNDFDGYTKRLTHIDDINRLRGILFEMTKDVPRQKRISDELKEQILQAIDDFDGYVDARSVSTWLLFSGKQINHISELVSHQMYNTVRTSNYDNADGYLMG